MYDVSMVAKFAIYEQTADLSLYTWVELLQNPNFEHLFLGDG